MSIGTIIEILLIIGIVVWQCIEFASTKKNIENLADVLPHTDKCDVQTVERKYYTQGEYYHLEKFFAKYKKFEPLKNVILYRLYNGGISNFLSILDDPTIDETQKEFLQYNIVEISEAALKESPTKKNKFFKIDYPEENEIVNSLNKYLEKNKGAVADFSLLRDITQRSIDAAEEEVNLTIQTPVYLGLAGTMFGIIIGIWNMPSINSQAFLEGDAISSLLTGVMIAMVASLVGLGFTTWNTSVKYKTVKVEIEREKNIFFTFLQTELLPVLEENVTTGLVGLNRNIENFGESFKQNVAQLEAMIDKNHQSLMAQQNAIETFKKIDVSQIAKFNINVLGEIRQSMDALEKLAYSLKNVDALVVNSKSIVERTSDVIDIAEQIGAMMKQSGQLQNFLYSHFNQLENRGQIINDAVVRVDDVIDRSLKGLESHIHERIQAVQDITLKSEDLLKTEIGHNANLLKKINSIDSMIDEFKKFSQKDVTLQQQILAAINQNNVLLQKIASQQSSNRSTQQQPNKPKSGSKPTTITSKTIIEVGDEKPVDNFEEIETKLSRFERFKNIFGTFLGKFRRTKRVRDGERLDSDDVAKQKGKDSNSNLTTNEG